MGRNRWFLTLAAASVSMLGPLGCNQTETPYAPYVCGFSPEALFTPSCGANDPNLPPEPTLPDPTIGTGPGGVCQTLVADKSKPDESRLDTARLQAALTACRGQGAVKLTSDGANNVFVAGHLIVDATTLWIDTGTTLYASRNASLYQITGNCGKIGVSDTDACHPLISATGTGPKIVGDGVIDGQGGEPLVGQDYSWWDMSNALRASNGSGPNPAMIEVGKLKSPATNVATVTGFVLYKITLHNSPKFHVKLSATAPSGTCSSPGLGFIVWGVTVLTPSRLTNSKGYPLTPYYSRNSDGIDPGLFNTTGCGVVACSTITTGDDQIALKAAHGLTDIVIAHNHFGTGHGMSFGSETNGGANNVRIYDLTIDGSSRRTGAPDTSTFDFNGPRVKSDESRGGIVTGISFTDVCVRDVTNAIVINTSYNPLYGGTLFPDFKDITIRNFHAVTCTALRPQVVDMRGFNTKYPVGPVTLDNVIVDGITPLDVSAQYLNVTLGPGNVNFSPTGLNVALTNNISGPSTPIPCHFPPLPAQQ